MATNRQCGAIYSKNIFWGQNAGTQRAMRRVVKDLVDDIFNGCACMVDCDHAYVFTRERIPKRNAACARTRICLAEIEIMLIHSVNRECVSKYEVGVTNQFFPIH